MSLNPDEEARAAAYRAQAGLRYANMRRRALGLSGDRGARLSLVQAWAPVTEWLREKGYRAFPGPGGGLEDWPDRPHGYGPHRGGNDADG